MIYNKKKIFKIRFPVSLSLSLSHPSFILSHTVKQSKKNDITVPLSVVHIFKCFILQESEGQLHRLCSNACRETPETNANYFLGTWINFPVFLHLLMSNLYLSSG